jgi:Zn finger protein HypA/HybF involved in hydrogenase expression
LYSNLARGIEKSKNNSREIVMDGELKRIRCSNCGRFHGFEAMEEGVVYLWCSECKQFTQVITEGFKLTLTEEEIYAILTSRGTKAQKVQ